MYWTNNYSENHNQKLYKIPRMFVCEVISDHCHDSVDGNCNSIIVIVNSEW